MAKAEVQKESEQMKKFALIFFAFIASCIAGGMDRIIGSGDFGPFSLFSFTGNAIQMVALWLAYLAGQIGESK